MKAAVASIGASLVLITPGAALALLQEWTPFLLTVAGMAGTALGLAVRNYTASKAHQAQLDRLERLVPKRQTDRVQGSASAPVALLLPPSPNGQQEPAAGSPVSGQVGTDG